MNDDFNQLKKRLADEIKSLRKKRGLSQEALALQAGVDRTYVSKLERGIANPSLQILQSIATVFRVRLQTRFIEPDKDS